MPGREAPPGTPEGQPPPVTPPVTPPADPNKPVLYDPITGTSLGGGVGSGSSRGAGQHQGIDIMAPKGSPVYSPLDGTIDSFGSDNFGTKITTIKHDDGTYSTFMHLSERFGKIGDRVKGGQQIGKSGTANGVEHLHFERWSGPPIRGTKGWQQVVKDPVKEFGWDKKNLPRGGQPARTAGTHKPGTGPTSTPAGGSSQFKPEVDRAIKAAAEESGLSEEMLRTFVGIESGGNPNDSTGKYKGLLQLSDKEFQQLGGKNIFDPGENMKIGAKKLKAEMEKYKEKTGQEPTAFDMYMVHQRGMAGYAKHKAEPNRPAWTALAEAEPGTHGYPSNEAWGKATVYKNIPADELAKMGGVDNITNEQFIEWWRKKYNQKTKQYNGGQGGSKPGEGKETPKQRPLKKNDKGEDVKKLQEALKKAGYPVKVDGDFGKETEDALKKYQSDNKLTVDGVAGPQTNAKLGIPTPGAPPPTTPPTGPFPPRLPPGIPPPGFPGSPFPPGWTFVPIPPNIPLGKPPPLIPGVPPAKLPDWVVPWGPPIPGTTQGFPTPPDTKVPPGPPSRGNQPTPPDTPPHMQAQEPIHYLDQDQQNQIPFNVRNHSDQDVNMREDSRPSEASHGDGKEKPVEYQGSDSRGKLGAQGAGTGPGGDRGGGGGRGDTGITELPEIKVRGDKEKGGDGGDKGGDGGGGGGKGDDGGGGGGGGDSGGGDGGDSSVGSEGGP
jgi:peptidoglycan hydrolase-like protein with peptidoglycan-binding domain